MQRKFMARHLVMVLLSLVLLSACLVDGNEFLGMPITQSTPVPTPTPAPTVEAVTPVPEENPETEEPDDSLNTLLLWVPPFMDPANGSQAGQLLQTQLDAFVAEHPEVTVNVRVKAEDGPASSLESLTAVSAVSPLELPSLIVLDRSDLETAGKKGLILPIGDYSSVINEVDWFQYARSLSVIGDSSYGLPLVGDVLVMVYREPVVEEGAETTAEETEDELDQIGFWRDDPESSVLLNHYLSLGGALVDEENQVILDEAVLTDVYSNFNAKVGSSLLYRALSDATSYQDVWEQFLAGEIDVVVVPSIYPLGGMPEDAKIVSLPSLTGYDQTMAKGWTVALADPLPERRAVAVALAEYLTEVTFMGQWSEALGYLPVRDTAFEQWESTTNAQRLALISVSARIYPSHEIIRTVSPALQAGLSAILEGVTPEEAAQIAVENLAVEE